MAQTDRINFRLGPQLRNALQGASQRYEKAEADIIRDALWMWLESKGYGPEGKTTKGGRRKKLTA